MSEVAFIRPGREPRVRPLLRTRLGEVLRRTRLEQSRTLADVARAAKVSMPYLSEVERGRKEASSEVLAALCDALKVELSDVLFEVGQIMAKDGASRSSVVQLAAARHHRSSPQAYRAGDVLLLAA